MKWMPASPTELFTAICTSGMPLRFAAAVGVLHVEHEHHHRRAGADEQRIDVDRQALHEALLHRMGHACGGGGVRCGAHAGLVGVQAALDAEHNDRSSEAAEDRLEVECRGEDEARRPWGSSGDVGDGRPEQRSRCRRCAMTGTTIDVMTLMRFVPPKMTAAVISGEHDAATRWRPS